MLWLPVKRRLNCTRPASQSSKNQKCPCCCKVSACAWPFSRFNPRTGAPSSRTPSPKSSAVRSRCRASTMRGCGCAGYRATRHWRCATLRGAISVSGVSVTEVPSIHHHAIDDQRDCQRRVVSERRSDFFRDIGQSEQQASSNFVDRRRTCPGATRTSRRTRASTRTSTGCAFGRRRRSWSGTMS